MKNVKINQIVQKRTRKSSKKGTIEIKFRSAFKNPLTNKRREIVSDWYEVKEVYDNTGKVIISNQIKSIVQRDMQNIANQLYQDISKQPLVSKQDITFELVWNEWQENHSVKNRLAPKTIAGMQGRYKNHMLKYIPPDSLLNNISSELVQSMLDDYYPKGNHKRIAQSLKSDLSSLYKFAVKRKYILIEENPIPNVQIESKSLEEKIQQLKNSNIESHYLEKDELKEVLNIVKMYNQQYARIFEFQALSGMRIGEILGLKVEDFDFENKTVAIVRTRATHGGAPAVNYEGNVKNVQSYRTILLSDRAIELVRDELVENEHHIIGNPDYVDNGWVFTSKNHYKADYNGTPLHYSVLNSFLNSSETGKLSKRTGRPKKVGINIDKRLSFNKHISTHIFRHTHISFLAEQGVPLEAIQERVGHNSGSRVTSIYLHVTKSMKKDITHLIDNLTNNDEQS
ncbi:site-specific integrase [Enterococcus faecalis]|nr:site-specific integrase [Enterococcus faecalis]